MGIGMYRPLEVIVTIACGGVVGWLAERRLGRANEAARASGRRRGVLLASGFLVGESVVGVPLAAADTLAAFYRIASRADGSADEAGA